MTLHSRVARVAELIKTEIGEIIDQKLTDPEVPPFVTVHSVKVSRDLRVADVSVTFLQDDNEETIAAAMKALGRAKGFIRGELARRVKLRYLPDLKFHYNPSTRYAIDMMPVFNKIETEGAEYDAREAEREAREVALAKDETPGAEPAGEPDA